MGLPRRFAPHNATGDGWFHTDIGTVYFVMTTARLIWRPSFVYRFVPAAKPTVRDAGG